MTKEEIIAIVKDCAGKLGHPPSIAELVTTGKLDSRQVRKHFGTHRRMLAESGLRREGRGYPILMRNLFLDWARIVRSLGKLPTVVEFELETKYSIRPLITRFRYWRDVPGAMLQWARHEGLEGEWQDVLDIIARDHQKTRPLPRTSGATSATTSSSTTRALSLDTERQGPRQARFWLPGADRQDPRQASFWLVGAEPVYGRPLPHSPLSYAPTNEAGVVLLFGSLARELGFVVMRVQSSFPDCEAMRERAKNCWQRVRIEFEYESHSFLEHMHPAEDCDLIVCWSHNWPDCPLEVLELQSLAGTCERSYGKKEDQVPC